ncbi:MAG: methyltransferase domain-containing protein [Candidatus Brocadiaceae bacterium]|nr:methyltransferase domain-containing protein [Candidatus Brocadiaceae bacterium]
MNTKNLKYLNEISYGYWKSQVLFVAVEMDLFTMIQGNGKSGKDITRKLRSDFRATEMMLNALVSLGLMSKTKGVYKNSVIANSYLVKNSPLYQGDRIRHFHNMWTYWSRLNDAIKSGKPTAFDNVGDDVNKKSLREFILSMHNSGKVQAEGIFRKLHLEKYHRLLDLAGGQGTYAVSFAEKNPDMSAVVFDLPDVIKITREHIKKSGLKGRIAVKAGNCLEDEFGKEQYDIVLVSHLLHIYEPVENKKILKKCWDSLLKNGIVVVHEFILNTAKTQPAFSALFSLNMLMGTYRGASYSAVEMKNWLKGAGFKDINRVNLSVDSGLIIGYK